MLLFVRVIDVVSFEFSTLRTTNSLLERSLRKSFGLNFLLVLIKLTPGSDDGESVPRE